LGEAERYPSKHGGTVKGHISLLFLISALLIPAAVFGQESDHDRCTNAALIGAYAFRVSGQVLPPGGGSVDREGVAMTRFDGKGKLTQVDFVMSNGLPVPGQADPVTGFHINETGWYRVNSDCTGMAEIQFPGPPGSSTGVIDLMFVLSNRGRTIHTIVARLVPPGSADSIPASIHSDGERLH
jgi:hypothetical protein